MHVHNNIKQQHAVILHRPKEEVTQQGSNKQVIYPMWLVKLTDGEEQEKPHLSEQAPTERHVINANLYYLFVLSHPCPYRPGCPYQKTGTGDTAIDKYIRRES